MKKIFSVIVCVCLLLSVMTISVHSTDSENAKFVISDTKARIGKEFSIDINISNNPGIVAAKIKLGYDADVLEFVSVKKGDFANTHSTTHKYTYGPSTKNPFVINWLDALTTKNIVADGVFVTVTFKVKDTAAAGTTEISITHNADDVYDKDFENVAFDAVGSKITIIENIPGDANVDGKANGRDYALMLQSINGWDNQIDNAASDVNGDGRINGRDYALLLQYINGWDVELKTS